MGSGAPRFGDGIGITIFNKQPWAIYTATGRGIVGEIDSDTATAVHRMASSEMILLVEGGNWIWTAYASDIVAMSP